MKGRKPKSNRGREAEGVRGHSRPLNRNEPKPAPTMPRMPSFLTKGARKEWKRLARALFELGILTSLDRNILAYYCLEYDRWVQAEMLIGQSGVVLKDKETGELRPNPALSAANRASLRMQSVGALLGLDPSSRSRIVVTAKPDDGNNAKRRSFKIFDDPAV